TDALLLARKGGIALRGKHVGMLGTDELKRSDVRCLVESADGVSAAEMEGVCLRKIVPKAFQLHGLFALTLSPKQRHHLTEGSNPGRLADASFRCVLDQRGDLLVKDIGNECAVHGELGQGLHRVKYHETAFGLG